MVFARVTARPHSRESPHLRDQDVHGHPIRRYAGWIFDTGVCHMAFFTDPDGNDLMLHNRYAGYE
jgi:hypothetical protein